MRERALMAAGLLAVALAGAGVVALFWDGGAKGGPQPTVASPSGIDAYADLATYDVQFGDTVTALVEVTVDRARVDPGSIRVGADFSPWQAVGRPVVRRFDGSSATYLETRYTIRCLESFCATDGPSGVFGFRPARVTYHAAEGDTDGPAATHTVQAAWPELLVRARYAPPRPSRDKAEKPPRWQAELVALPRPDYRLDPWLLVAVLLTGALVCGAAAVLLARRVLRPLVAAAAPASVGSANGRVATPLEQALALLEEPVRAHGDRRRALELVADVLVRHGARALALSTRALAWSRAVPRSEETQTVARKARTELEGGAHDRMA